MAATSALPIYVRTRQVNALTWWQRGMALAISACCFGVLFVAAGLNPDSRGVGTHEQLGLQPCGFVQMFGLPCPSCGYTTSFSLFAHGQLLRSAFNQPAGFLIAVATAMTAWAALYIGITGNVLHRLFGAWVTQRAVLGAGLLIVLAWGWKIALVKLAGV